ncbi:MAG TPA: murein biosynthesis integral membrane protein MurJ [Polyangiaceae bacterium]|nr:murein biosynthesis integral membrane protein MurJ [Polyangiaceae bacterium]
MSTGEHERRQLTGRAGIVAAGTLGSRMLGLVRDQVIAASFVAASTDAFFVAFTIPNVLRQLLAEGAVQNAALPVLERVRERSGETAARAAFAAMRGLSLLVLLVTTVIGIVFAGELVDLFAAGYRQHAGQFERTVTLTRWLFPYIFFMGTAALSVAALNVHRRFFVTAFAPGLLNIAFILAALVLPSWLAAQGRDPILALAAGALLGGVLQVVAQWPSLRRIGYLTTPRLSFAEPAVKETLRRMGPVLIGIGVYYIDVVLARRFLSELDVGAQSYFGWAMRLCDFPQGIFVMALQAATLPSLSRLVARGEMDEVARTFTFAMRLTLFVGIAATAACVALAEPLTVLLFQRGRFDAHSAHETARSLVAQGLGIWMVAAVRQLVSLYYALGDTKTPVRVAAIDLGVFVVCALLLRAPLGHVGVSFAVTSASFVQMVLLWWGLRARVHVQGMSEIGRSVGKTTVAAVAAAGLARLVATLATSSSSGAWDLAKPGVAASITFVVSFLAISWAVRSDELRVLASATRRSRQRAAS